MKIKPCKYCGGVDHFAFTCFRRPRQERVRRQRAIVQKSRLQRKGAVTEKWIATRKEWLKENPGPYECYICLKPLTRGELTLDHIKSRSRYPELRFIHSNLAPCCYTCNTAKGSRDLEQYLANLRKE